jgi:hypothetical protein
MHMHVALVSQPKCSNQLFFAKLRVLRKPISVFFHQSFSHMHEMIMNIDGEASFYSKSLSLPHHPPPPGRERAQ